MTEPLPDTWDNRDLLVLRAAVAGVDLDVHRFGIGLDLLSDATGLKRKDVMAAVRALAGDGLIQQRPGRRSDKTDPIVGVSGDARRLTGSWPTPETALERMIAALEEIANNTDDDDTRTRAKRFGDWLKGAGSTVGLSVAAAAITGQLPHP